MTAQKAMMTKLNRMMPLSGWLDLRQVMFLVRLLHFLLNFKIADSDPVSVKLAVDEGLKNSRPAPNDFDCGVFLFLR